MNREESRLSADSPQSVRCLQVHRGGDTGGVDETTGKGGVEIDYRVCGQGRKVDAESIDLEGEG